MYYSKKALAQLWPRWCIGMRLRLYKREEKGSLLLWISSKTSQSSFVHKKISAFFLTKCRSFNLAIFFVERENWIRTFTTALGPLSCPIIGSLKKRNTKQRNCTLGSREFKYSRLWNKHSPTLINFLTFFQGLRPYSGFHRAYFSSINIRYKWSYTY